MIERLLSPAEMMRGIDRVAADDAQVLTLGYGKAIESPGGLALESSVAIVDSHGDLVAVGEVSRIDMREMIRPRRVLRARH